MGEYGEQKQNRLSKLNEYLLNEQFRNLFFTRLTILICEKTFPQLAEVEKKEVEYLENPDLEMPSYDAKSRKILEQWTNLVKELAPLRTFDEFKEYCHQHGRIFPSDSEIERIIESTQQHLLIFSEPKNIQ